MYQVSRIHVPWDFGILVSQFTLQLIIFISSIFRLLQDEFQAPSADFDPELEICAGHQTFGGKCRLINASFKAEEFEYTGRVKF